MSKITLVCLHGFLQDSRIFKQVLMPLESEFTLLIPDLPGFGNHTVGITKNSLLVENQRVWLKHYLEQVQSDHIVILGYSMGARLVLQSLSQIQHLISGCIIESGTNGIEDTTQRERRKQSDSENAVLIRTNFKQFLHHWDNHPTLKPVSPFSTSVQELVRKVQAEQNPEFAAFSLESFGTAAMPFLDSTYFNQITCTVLFIAGQQDSKFAEKATELTSYNPFFSKAIIPNCGHRVHLEKTSEYLNLIKAFIYDLYTKHKR